MRADEKDKKRHPWKLIRETGKPEEFAMHGWIDEKQLVALFIQVHKVLIQKETNRKPHYSKENGDVRFIAIAVASSVLVMHSRGINVHRCRRGILPTHIQWNENCASRDDGILSSPGWIRDGDRQHHIHYPRMFVG